MLFPKKAGENTKKVSDTTKLMNLVGTTAKMLMKVI